MLIKNTEIDIDIIQEINLLGITGYKITGDTLSACSPLRDDKHPSFYIYYRGKYKGIWGDRGGLESQSKGNIAYLISLIKHVSLDEAENYLLSKYNYKENITTIPFKTLKFKFYKEVDLSYFNSMSLDYEYLNTRGISSHYARVNDCREDGDLVALAWHDVNGNIKNIKYRSKTSKKFHYESGTPISNMVYGIHHVYKHNINTLAICESEINALSWQSIGIMGVAVGGSSISDKQAQLIRDSGVVNIVLSGDNDNAGTKLNNQIVGKLGRLRFKYFMPIFNAYNDVNDLLQANLLSRKLLKKY